jgi:16S rRNA (cytosine967-C5)-methyltransferase
MLAPCPGESLLDLCAAPGGKTCAAAELMENDGRILALDVHPHRVKLIEKEAARLGHKIIKTAVSDASGFDPQMEGRWDKVIADVPCSALGTIARDPEIKLRELTEDQAEEYVKELAAKQSAILANACRYVKPGGTVLYSTCTVDPAENEEITGAFMKAHEGYTVVKSRLLLPDRKGQEGFYTCLIRRNDDQHRF